MNVIDVAQKIQEKISEIDKIRSALKERGETKAVTLSEYDKRIALVLIGLRNGEAFELEEKRIDNPPATIMEKIAKGICWKEKLDMETAEASYKSVITNLDSVTAQLNAFQSLNRYLDKI